MGIADPPQKELTLNQEANANCPNDSCDCLDNLILVPNGETEIAHECLIRGTTLESEERDVHAEHDQERSRGDGQIPNELEREKSRSARHYFPLRLGASEGLLTKWEVISTFGSWPIRGSRFRI